MVYGSSDEETELLRSGVGGMYTYVTLPESYCFDHIQFYTFNEGNKIHVFVW